MNGNLPDISPAAAKEKSHPTLHTAGLSPEHPRPHTETPTGECWGPTSRSSQRDRSFPSARKIKHPHERHCFKMLGRGGTKEI